MSNCSNCYNGCTEIVSDKCVKYTGIDVPILGITNGDTLLHVEQTLINFLVPMLNGTGIIPDISNSIICETVSKYLPTCSTCTGFTLKDILIALIKAACDLQEQINNLQEQIDEIESPYTTSCLSGVTSSSNTHDVLQAVINKLCQVDSNLTALALDVSTNYVQISDLDTLIQNYIDESGQNTLIKNRMVPFAVVPYFGPITFFDGSGAGTGDWNRIFLCNGNNGTPDLRGRTLVGVTDGTMLGGTMNPTVNPGGGNPNYALGTPAGSNQVTLDLTQMPNHTHTITSVATVNDPGHFHNVQGAASGNGFPKMDNGQGVTGNTTTNQTGITVNVTSSASFEGGGLPHSNIQPSIGCRYIIYIP
jgi:microcystin-dependent protein